MKIAIALSPRWRREQFAAEFELARRFRIAGQACDLDIELFLTKADLQAFQPDFVLAFHSVIAKLVDLPTYGTLWCPPEAMNHPSRINNIVAYDGHGYGSDKIAQVVARWTDPLPRRYLKTTLYPSTQKTVFSAPEQFRCEVPYVGSNWDGFRHRALFEVLTAQGRTHFYGRAEGWPHVGKAFQGEIPHDGASLLDLYHRYGVGLCLHKQDHFNAETPSMRIFEILAASALPICDPHAFIQRAFGDTVLYLDHEAPPADQARQLSDHLDWIQAHPQTAREMVEAAHQVFVSRFCLEVLLERLVQEHHAFQRQRAAEHEGLRDRVLSQGPVVEVVLRLRRGHPQTTTRALESIARQTYPHLNLVVIHATSENNVDQAPPEHRFNIDSNRFQTIRHIVCPGTHDAAMLSTAVQSIQADYVCLMTEYDVLFPGHIERLVGLFLERPGLKLAYSGAVKLHERETASGQWERFSPDEDTDTHEPAFPPGGFPWAGNLIGMNVGLTLGGCLMTRNSIPKTLLQTPLPALDTYEDTVFLDLLAGRLDPGVAEAVFSGDVSYAFTDPADRVSPEQRQTDFNRCQVILAACRPGLPAALR